MVGLLRRFSLPLLLVLAIGVPYAIHGDGTASVRDQLRSLLSESPDQTPAIEGIDDPVVNRLLAQQQQLAADGQSTAAAARRTPAVSLESVLRFDVTPRWVIESWPRVSTTRIDGPLDGLRVPLVTGTGPSDVVGSLTYYFDHNQRVQRIALDGVVGDERQLVSVVTRVFELVPEPTAGTGVFLAKWNGKPTSALLVYRMPVVSVENSLQKFAFRLELNRPTNNFGLSASLQQALQQTQASKGSHAFF